MRDRRLDDRLGNGRHHGFKFMRCTAREIHHAPGRNLDAEQIPKRIGATFVRELLILGEIDRCRANARAILHGAPHLFREGAAMLRTAGALRTHDAMFGDFKTNWWKVDDLADFILQRTFLSREKCAADIASDRQRMNDGMVDGEAFLERCTGMLELPTHVRAALWLEGFRPTLQAVRGRRLAGVVTVLVNLVFECRQTLKQRQNERVFFDVRHLG